MCNPADGSCSNPNLADGSFCDAGDCQSGQCEPIASVFPCDEQGILDAILAGGGPHGFDCDGPTVVTTTAEIGIIRDVILDGRDNLTVDGNDDHPVLSVPLGITAELRRFAVTGGFSEGSYGGGISNAGTLGLSNSTVSGNSVQTLGAGGIWNQGTMTVSNSTVSGNSVGDYSIGGVGNVAGSSTLTMTNSTVSENTGEFGGIWNAGSLTMTNSTVSGNAGEQSGGIFNNVDGALTVTNSTVSGNTGEWTGIFNEPFSALTITNSTVSGNTAESGASIVNVTNLPESAELTIANSLVDGDCVGWSEGLLQGAPDITSNGYNIESPGDTCGFRPRKR